MTTITYLKDKISCHKHQNAAFASVKYEAVYFTEGGVVGGMGGGVMVDAGLVS